MRRLALGLSMLSLSSCAKPTPVVVASETSSDVPVHTQALMDAYRQRESMRSAPAVQGCPSDPSPAQLGERYLHAVGGCAELPSIRNPELAVASRAQWPALYAALDARNEAVTRCVRASYAWFDVHGVLSTRIEVAADGKIEAVSTPRDDAQHAEVACCVRRELAQVHLPSPGRALALEHETPYLEPSREGKPPRLTEAQLRPAIERQQAQLAPCWSAASAAGHVLLRFVIAPDGSVSRTHVEEDTLAADGAACCVAERVRSWTFPRPEGEGVVVVSYPFAVQRGS